MHDKGILWYVLLLTVTHIGMKTVDFKLTYCLKTMNALQSAHSNLPNPWGLTISTLALWKAQLTSNLNITINLHLRLLVLRVIDIFAMLT